MKIYNYDKETKEFLGVQEATPSPKEEGKFLKPANSTEVEPKTPEEGKANVFDELANSWGLVEDNRGTLVYSTESKEESSIDYLGSIKEGFTLLVPAPFDIWSVNEWIPDLDAIKDEKLRDINDSCEAEIISGFPSSALGSEFLYQSDRDDQINLMGLVTSGADDLLKCDDGSLVDWRAHTIAQLTQVFEDGASFKKAALIKAQTLKNQVEGATDVASVEAVTW